MKKIGLLVVCMIMCGTLFGMTANVSAVDVFVNSMDEIDYKPSDDKGTIVNSMVLSVDENGEYGKLIKGNEFYRVVTCSPFVCNIVVDCGIFTDNIYWNNALNVAWDNNGGEFVKVDLIKY